MRRLFALVLLLSLAAASPLEARLYALWGQGEAGAGLWTAFELRPGVRGEAGLALLSPGEVAWGLGLDLSLPPTPAGRAAGGLRASLGPETSWEAYAEGSFGPVAARLGTSSGCPWWRAYCRQATELAVRYRATRREVYTLTLATWGHELVFEHRASPYSGEAAGFGLDHKNGPYVVLGERFGTPRAVAEVRLRLGPVPALWLKASDGRTRFSLFLSTRREARLALEHKTLRFELGYQEEAARVLLSYALFP